MEAQFKKAAWLIANGPPPEKEATNDQKLQVYGLFKQATKGDINISQPWAVQVEARAKWEAWNKLKGMSKEEAMKQYVDLLSTGDPNWESHEALKDYKE